MKKILLFMSALVLTLSAQAQQPFLAPWVTEKPFSSFPSGLQAKTTPASRVLKRDIALGDNQIWWGYFSDGDAASLEFDGYLGFSAATTITTGIHVYGSNPIVGGAKVVGVRFWLGDDISQISSDLTIWISTQLPDDVSSSTYTQTVPRSALKSRLNEIQLTTPFDGNNADFYIGYSFSIANRAYPVMGGGEDQQGGWLFSYTGSGWMDFYGEDYGNLAFQLLLDGVTLADNSVVPSDFTTSYVVKGANVTVPVKITNYGNNAVTSVSYTITSDGVTSEEQTLSVNRLTFNSSDYISVSLAADSDTKRYSKLLTITKVNGEPNEASEKSAAGSLITISEKPVAVPVVEEFTGTWCGWCPVGWDGMEKTHEKYGDKVVLIAAHSGDELQCDDCRPILGTVSSYPSCHVDREWDIYPSARNLDNVVSTQLERVTVGTVDVKAQWSSDAQTAVNITAVSRFVYSDDSADYGVAFVLLADGLTNSSWKQANYLSGRAGYESYTFWYNSGSAVSGLEFNHVPVAAWNIGSGFDGSVSSTVVADEAQTFTYEADITGKSLIQDKTKLSVAALLIDRSTGCIVNAAKTAIEAADEYDAIDAPASDVSQQPIYNLAGQRQSALRRGINIVGGRKIVVK